MGITVGIDASRNRSGGAKAHLLGLIGERDPRAHGIHEVHVWSYKALLDVLPDAPWLIKHNPPQLERSLFHQVWWQYRSLPKEAREHGCQILLNTDAGSVCRFRPAVVMSRDMLSYERGEMKRYGLSKARIRLMLLRLIQTSSMRRADGVIFLTRYAAETIQKITGRLARVAVIPHGVGAAFRQDGKPGTWAPEPGKIVTCLYVSNAAMYKHQWTVVRAMGALRKRGYFVRLVLAGGGSGPAKKLLDETIASIDPAGDFVQSVGFVPHDSLPALLKAADVFIFASTCENMPNTLVEGMASGLPIACSDRGPMPEVLADGGVFFNPEDAASIASAVESIIDNEELRASIAKRARVLSEQYSWSRCAGETWDFLRETLQTR